MQLLHTLHSLVTGLRRSYTLLHSPFGSHVVETLLKAIAEQEQQQQGDASKVLATASHANNAVYTLDTINVNGRHHQDTRL